MNVLLSIFLPCGATATFENSDVAFGYRCDKCGAVVAQPEMPIECKNLLDQNIVWLSLGGKRWDFTTGKYDDEN